MLRFCCRHPPALEMVLNTLDRVPEAESWVQDVPPELWEVRGRCRGCRCPRSPARSPRCPPAVTPSPPQEHREFYASAVRMAGRPRRLQHLARCALRRHLGARCHLAVPKLALPPHLRRYLQLPLEGIIS